MREYPPGLRLFEPVYRRALKHFGPVVEDEQSPVVKNIRIVLAQKRSHQAPDDRPGVTPMIASAPGFCSEMRRSPGLLSEPAVQAHS